MKLPRRRKGQTLIEFAFVSVLFIFMLVITFNAILAFVAHQYISYATFMAARAYQASADMPQRQVENAKETFAQYIPGLTGTQVNTGMSFPVVFERFSPRKIFARITGVQISSPTPMTYGMRAESEILVSFEVPFAQLPLGSAIGSQISFLKLTARSSLGREVTAAECQAYFRSRYEKVLNSIKEAPGLKSGNAGYVQGLWKNMEDNGC